MAAYKKYLDTGKEVLKTVTAVGNGVITGLIAGIGFPNWGIPLKICASISGLIIGGIITDKTDTYIDIQAEHLYEEIDKVIKPKE